MEQSKIPPPPQIVAVSGIVFTMLLSVSLIIVRLALPADPHDPGEWLTQPITQEWVRWSLNLVPFAGLAFLWFMATFRNHLGHVEDKFFASVFLGSGFLFVAMMFVAVALSQGLLETVAGRNDTLTRNESYQFGRASVHALVNFFGMRMAAVFMIVTSTIGLRSRVLPQWLCFTGIGSGVTMLVGITLFAWIALLFPAWVMLVSCYILVVSSHNVERTERSDPLDR
jgi:hypothetical protein